MFINGFILSLKQCFLQSMTSGCLNSKRQLFLVIVVGFSMTLNDSTGVVEVINKLNLLRSEIDKASPLLLQSFDFSTLYTEISLVDLKAHMRVLINKVFNWMQKLHHFKFLMVQKTALNFRFLWLKNKAEINLVENLHSFKIGEASDLISWLDFLGFWSWCL
jgi:hypothetical protein